MSVNPTSIWPILDEKDRRLFVRHSELASAETAFIGCFVADMKSGPDPQAALDAQLLHGDGVSVLETKGGQARVRNARDGYIGWVEREALCGKPFKPTHRVIAPRTFLYPDLT